MTNEEIKNYKNYCDENEYPYDAISLADYYNDVYGEDIQTEASELFETIKDKLY